MTKNAVNSYPGCIAFEGDACISGYKNYDSCPGFLCVDVSNEPPTCKQQAAKAVSLHATLAEKA
jgi:hypothetical protein